MHKKALQEIKKQEKKELTICTLPNLRPPGGTYTLPPAINGTNADAAGQDRGGQGPTGVVPTTNSTAAAPTQAEIAANCTKFAYAGSGDTCYGFTQSFGISMAELTLWNPALGYPDGHNCTTQFWLGSVSIYLFLGSQGNRSEGEHWGVRHLSHGLLTLRLLRYDYCVEVNGGSSTITTTSVPPSSSTATTTSLAFPTQSGIISTCNKFKDAESGDYCSNFASDNGITTAQLYAWNTILGPNGENCNTQFQAGVDYCVGVSSSSSTTGASTTVASSTTTATTSVIPTQSGIAANCNKIVMAQSGDYCYLFAQENSEYLP